MISRSLVEDLRSGELTLPEFLSRLASFLFRLEFLFLLGVVDSQPCHSIVGVFDLLCGILPVLEVWKTTLIHKTRCDSKKAGPASVGLGQFQEETIEEISL